MDIEAIRQDFPILKQKVHGEDLIYFDNAATSQKPRQVIQAMVDYYQADNANIHRGVHSLSQRATDLYEGTRKKVADYLGCQAHELIFNRGTTEGINFLVRSLVEDRLEAGDQVMASRLDHHSVLVPVQEVCRRRGADLVYLPLDDQRLIDFEALDQMDTSRVRAIVTQQVSNVLGLEQDIKRLARWTHERDILLLVDGAQAVPHMAVNVVDLDVDGYAFSGHKTYGPTGIGATYLADRYHGQAQPVFFGGEMIHEVGDYQSNFKDSPWKFEAGTMPIAEVVGLGAALDYIEEMGYPAIQAHEEALADRLYQGLVQIEGLVLYQAADLSKHGIISFNFAGVHPHDAATAYDLEGVAVRAGHHCCQPLMRLLDCQACLRASLAVYNTEAEVDRFLAVSQKVSDFFSGFR